MPPDSTLSPTQPTRDPGTNCVSPTGLVQAQDSAARFLGCSFRSREASPRSQAKPRAPRCCSAPHRPPGSPVPLRVKATPQNRLCMMGKWRGGREGMGEGDWAGAEADQRTTEETRPGLKSAPSPFCSRKQLCSKAQGSTRGKENHLASHKMHAFHCEVFSQ